MGTIVNSEKLLAKEFQPFAEIMSKPHIFEELAAAGFDPGVPGKKISIPDPEADRNIDLYIYRPKNAGDEKTPVIYYAHGGGYLLGAANMHGDMFSQMADTHHATIISVEYRLAIEAPYPADIHDAYSGLIYVYNNADKLCIDKDRIIIMGESAGGGLTARLALYNKDHANIPLIGQVLVYPMLDYRTGGEDDLYQNIYGGEYVWHKDDNQKGWMTLRGDQQIPEDEMPYYSAATASDEQLKGLPPTFITVGALDVFANESLTYANRLILAGISTEIYVIPGVFHAFDGMVADCPQTDIFNTVKKSAIDRLLTT